MGEVVDVVGDAGSCRGGGGRVVMHRLFLLFIALAPVGLVFGDCFRPNC